jgi:acylphosphatase
MARYQGKGKGNKSGRRGRRGLTLGMSIAGVIVVAAAIGWFAYRASADLPGEKFADLGNEHIQTASDPHTPYNSEPPTSGPHLPYIAPWGIHTRPITNELQVHNLEDGGVMVQYNCECPELVEKLRNIVRKYDKQVILAPYPTMKSRIALTAWTRLEKFEEFDEKRIVRFIDAYRGIDHHKR